jgi:hypothetical protein
MPWSRVKVSSAVSECKTQGGWIGMEAGSFGYVG